MTFAITFPAASPREPTGSGDGLNGLIGLRPSTPSVSLSLIFAQGLLYIPGESLVNELIGGSMRRRGLFSIGKAVVPAEISRIIAAICG